MGKIYIAIYENKADDSAYFSALKLLSDCLASAYGKNVIILIDEYDVPLENAYFNGFYDEMIEALKKAGFDKNNPNHLLIGLGDYWDRGLKPKQVMDYLLSLPNKVLIKGNHEDLIIDLCRRKFTKSHDYSNGTVLTLGALSPDANSYKELFENGLKISEEFQADMKDYFETSNYLLIN